MAKTQTKLDDFVKGVEEEEELHRVPETEFEDRETLQAEFGEVYENYIVEGYTSDIASKFGGTNTAVRLTSPTGEKVVLWVGGFEQDHFTQKMAQWARQEVELPVEISFARVKQASGKTDREYNRLKIKTIATGEDVKHKLASL